MRRRIITLAAVLAVAAAAALSAQQAPAAATQPSAPEFNKLLEQIDMHLNFDTDFSATFQMVDIDPTQGTNVFKILMFRRDTQDKFVMLFLQPETRKGTGYLRLEDNIWIYDPISRKFTHSTLKDNFEGSSAKNSDMRKSMKSVDYTTDGYTEGKLGAYDVWIADLHGVNDEVPYPFIRMWVRKSDLLILKVEDYSLTKRLLRTALYPGYARVGNKFVPSTQIFVDALVPGKKTQITVSDISVDALPNDLFTKTYIERVNR